MCPLISTSLPMSSALRASARSLGSLMRYLLIHAGMSTVLANVVDADIFLLGVSYTYLIL